MCIICIVYLCLLWSTLENEKKRKKDYHQHANGRLNTKWGMLNFFLHQLLLNAFKFLPAYRKFIGHKLIIIHGFPFNHFNLQPNLCFWKYVFVAILSILLPWNGFSLVPFKRSAGLIKCVSCRTTKFIFRFDCFFEFSVFVCRAR